MAELPKELPEVPTGWTKHMTLHLNFGHGKKGGGMGVYAIKDAYGNDTPIKYQYDTRKGGETGFFLPDLPHCVSWKELRELWPVFLAKQPNVPAQGANSEPKASNRQEMRSNREADTKR